MVNPIIAQLVIYTDASHWLLPHKSHDEVIPTLVGYPTVHVVLRPFIYFQVSLVSISALPPSLIAWSRWQSCAG